MLQAALPQSLLQALGNLLALITQIIASTLSFLGGAPVPGPSPSLPVPSPSLPVPSPSVPGTSPSVPGNPPSAPGTSPSLPSDSPPGAVPVDSPPTGELGLEE
jgi:hypothetical protein